MHVVFPSLSPLVLFNETIDRDTGTVAPYLHVYLCPYPFSLPEAVLNIPSVNILLRRPKQTTIFSCLCKMLHVFYMFSKHL